MIKYRWSYKEIIEYDTEVEERKAANETGNS